MADDPLLSGSTGAGFCLEDGVDAEVEIDQGAGRPGAAAERIEVEVTLNGATVPAPTCESVVRSVLAGCGPVKARVRLSSRLPAGFGYGISGASALSTAIALNNALGMGLPLEELGRHAHVAEVTNLTGLGDVHAQLVGGFEMRLKPGAPGYGRVERIDLPGDCVVVSSPVEPFPTNRMVTEPPFVDRINRLGSSALASFQASPDLRTFMRLSRGFWEGVGIATAPMLAVMKEYELAGITSPSAKKGLVFGFVRREGAEAVVRRLLSRADSGTRCAPAGLPHPTASGHGIKVILSEISKGGAY